MNDKININAVEDIKQAVSTIKSAILQSQSRAV